MKSKKNNNLTYISLFSSAGIGCYGFKEAAYKCLATVELLDKRIKFQKFNNICDSDEGYISGDIANEAIKKNIAETVVNGLKKLKQDTLDVLIATPPCQGMSVANHKKGNELPRNSLVVESISLVKELQPKFFIFENVPSFLSTSCLDSDGKSKDIKAAIDNHLNDLYKYEYKKINFCEYGSGSSRTRCLVVGIRRDLKHITPDELFPSREQSPTLKSLIGALPRLEWGEINKEDIFHSFRTYKSEMRDWISHISEGESAFDNFEPLRRPHAVKDGVLIEHKRGNGDKYRRQIWNKIAPCVHTRNDILASQNTVHPEEDRVFSIRELMKMMTIPDSFQFSETSNEIINKLSIENKIQFLKSEELNIRHCIGEAVPTRIFKKIADNIKSKLLHAIQSPQIKFSEFQKKFNIKNQSQLALFIQKNGLKDYSVADFQFFSEIINTSKDKDAAYYTNPDLVEEIVKNLPEFSEKKSLRVLEPSVGSGAFVTAVINKYRDKNLTFDVIDINGDSLSIVEAIVSQLNLSKKIKINYISGDFLLQQFKKKYDLVVGNPPFLKINKKFHNFQIYKSNSKNSQSSNLFIFFLERAIEIADYVCLIVPKSIVGSPEFNETRRDLSRLNFFQIHDFGEDGFKGVLIETVALGFFTSQVNPGNSIKIFSRIQKNNFVQKQRYVMSHDFPTWLLYRDKEFDFVAKSLKFNLFEVFRDRQITSKILDVKGKYRVLKSKNIGVCSLVDTDHDLYADTLDGLVVSKF